ncbi:MAG TPA: hypothetical protein VIP50_06640 [Agromyces sp.]
MSEHDDELSTLRARAYGPGADIYDDAEAVIRLRELEARQRDIAERRALDAERIADTAAEDVDLAPVSGEADTDAATPADLVDGVPVSGAAAATTTAPPTEEGDQARSAADDERSATPRKPWSRRRLTVVWAVSLIAALVVGAAMATSFQAVVTGQVAVLNEDPDGAWPEDMLGARQEGAVIFDSFGGLTLLTTPETYLATTENPMTCLYIFVERMGYIGGSCGAGPFPPTGTMFVTRESPQPLRERFEDGTALRFELDGSQVRVYAAPPAPEPADTP